MDAINLHKNKIKILSILFEANITESYIYFGHSGNSCHTLLPAPLGKNIKSNALNYHTCSEACCGQLAWHHDAIEDQKIKNRVNK